MAPTIEAALTALREHFGFEGFREGQREVIESILEGHDTVVVMPTGGGKSLCFQLPAMMREGATLVVSPLIALMKDQVDALHARGLPATFINSSIDFEEQRARITGMREGRFKLVYVAPERFRSQHFVETLLRAGVSLFAIDEAHCISQWGHDFRPDYLRLKSFLEQIGRPQTVALTATATPYVRADIIEQLSLRDPRAFVSGFDRPNLSIGVVHTQKERDKTARVKALANAYEGGSGIVYSSTRKSVEQVAQRMKEARLSVVAYHAGMADDERVRAQDDFMSGRVQMIVATNAFGMGIDKPDIRFVAHHHLPGSIEAYYQEIGRAGRDGLNSTCMLLFNYADKRTQDYFIEGSYPPPEVIAKVYEALVGTGQRRIELSTREIAARAGVRNEMAVQSSLVVLEKAGHVERGAGAENRATVRLLVSAQEARDAANSRRSALLKQGLLGLLGGFDLSQRAETDIDVAEMGEIAGLDVQGARRALGALAEAGLITYQPARRTRGVQLLDERPVSNLRIRPQELARRAALEQRKLREMISFCYTDRCYRAFILDYFGDSSYVGNCGKCGNCLAATASHAGAATAAGAGLASAPPAGAPLDDPTSLDRFMMKHVPVGLELEDELGERKRVRRAGVEAERRAAAFDDDGADRPVVVTEQRELLAEEMLYVRKILACAARMQGRFGKNLLAATLRGSRSAKITQAGLDELSTFGILSGMTQDEILLYVDALVSAGCLHVTAGAYPLVELTEAGGEVMRERAEVRLALPAPRPPATRYETTPTAYARPRESRAAARGDAPVVPRRSTMDETYDLYCQGVTIEEICRQRGLTEMTVEKHLADCIVEGRAFDISPHVPAETRALIEAAAERIGVERLKPLRDELPRHVTYRMIRFVVADLQRATPDESGVSARGDNEPL
ncbi:MAG TPA: RecQ family ATP-dependent DNA helicase [Pyrinomonadaceae bacterium]